MSIQEQIMQQRAADGLKLTFRIPGRQDLFVCYPKDDASKARWLANAETNGWSVA